jgi:hypothetical protein
MRYSPLLCIDDVALIDYRTQRGSADAGGSEHYKKFDYLMLSSPKDPALPRWVL